MRELSERREAVMRAMQQLHASWTRAREWDQQLADAQSALSQAHRRFGEFYDFVPMPFVVLDDRLLIQQANEAARRLLDSADGQLGQPFAAFVAQEGLRELMAALSRTPVGEVCRLELRVRSQHGWVPCELVAKSTERHSADHSQPRPCYNVALVDLSEVRRLELERRRAADAERAAHAAAKAKDEFIAMLSHELRTPLTPILAAVDALRESDLPEAVRAAAAIIRRNVQTEARLVDDLLDVARLTQKRLTIDTRPLSLHGLIEVVAADWAAEAARAGLDVRLELGASADEVNADAGRIAQVLRNLLGNALKFTDAGGRVSVRTEDGAQGWLRLCVEDTGRGMSPGQVLRLFEPFAESRSQFGSRAGLGLGLVISHGIVEAHGGRIRVHSPGPGQGTTVEIELPVAEQPGRTAPRGTASPVRERASVPRSAPAGSPPGTEQPQASANARVLLVEDHADSAETLSMVLSMRGYQVMVARSVREAEGLLADCDLVISDIALPDGSGLELVSRARRQPPLRAISLSGYGTEDDRRRSRDAGFAEHLTKPVDIEHLLAALRRLAPPAAAAG